MRWPRRGLGRIFEGLVVGGCAYRRMGSGWRSLAIMTGSLRDERRSNSHRADGDYQPIAISHIQEPDDVYAARAASGAAESGRSTLELSRGATGVLPEFHVGSFDDPASFVPRAASPLNFVN